VNESSELTCGKSSKVANAIILPSWFKTVMERYDVSINFKILGKE
jgi:hypothetical protein